MSPPRPWPGQLSPGQLTARCPRQDPPRPRFAGEWVLTAHGAELPEFVLRSDAQPVLQYRHPSFESLPALGRREDRLGHAGQRAGQRYAGVGAAAAVAPAGRQPAPAGQREPLSARPGAPTAAPPQAGTGSCIPPAPVSPPAHRRAGPQAPRRSHAMATAILPSTGSLATARRGVTCVRGRRYCAAAVIPGEWMGGERGRGGGTRERPWLGEVVATAR